MNIPFQRIKRSSQPFEIALDDLFMEGVLEQTKRDFVLLNGHMSGKVEVLCDLCAEPFDIMLDEDVRLLLYNGIYNGADSQYDIIEIENSIIEMRELLHSEKELIKSDYHRCKTCNNN